MKNVVSWTAPLAAGLCGVLLFEVAFWGVAPTAALRAGLLLALPLAVAVLVGVVHLTLQSEGREPPRPSP